MASYHETLQRAIQELNSLNIENSDLDAWYLLSHICGMSRTDYLLRRMEKIPEQQYEQFQQLLARRMEREPVQYIIGQQEFMGLKFMVDPNVLIPRQDTEILVELALSQCNDKKVLDVCTGSGCIAISIAKLGTPRSVTALDISQGALGVAKENANSNGVEIELIQSNMFQEVTQFYDIIVSNPPYIKSKVIDTLMPEVRQYEPVLALDGNVDGLEFYRILANEAKNHLEPEGKVIFEIGCEQAEDVQALLVQSGYDNILVMKDYANLNRVVSASWNK